MMPSWQINPRDNESGRCDGFQIPRLAQRLQSVHGPIKNPFRCLNNRLLRRSTVAPGIKNLHFRMRSPV